jgi:hypothetical protein
VDPDSRIAALLPAQRVIGCVVHASCAAREPGWIRHVMGNGLLLGEACGGGSESLDAVTALLAEAGFGARAVPSIQREAWYKLWGNMTTNPVSALTRATTDRILADDLVREFTTSIMREAAEVGARMGCPIEQTPADRHAITRSLGAFKTSMLQDIEAGRAIETDALLAAPRELAQQLGVATPMLDALLGLTRLMDACRSPSRPLKYQSTARPGCANIDPESCQTGAADARNRQLQREPVHDGEAGRVCAGESPASPDPRLGQRRACQDGREVLGDVRGRHQGRAPQHCAREAHARNAAAGAVQRAQRAPVG